MVSSSHKKEAVKHVVGQGFCSLRRACRYLRLHRSTYLYECKRESYGTQTMVRRIIRISKVHSRYCYRRIRALMDKEGWKVSRKFVQKVRRAEGLGVKPSRRRQRRRGHSTGLPTKAVKPNHVWSWDFVADHTDRGGQLRMMTLIDEYTRKCLAIKVSRSLKSENVLQVLVEAIEVYGSPQYIRSDKGSQFAAKKVREALLNNQIDIIYIDPGSPLAEWLC